MNRLSCPNLFTFSAEKKIESMINQRMDEGVYTACVNTLASLDSIENSYNQIKDTMSSIGMSATFEKTKIDERLDEIISSLTTVDVATEFSDDPVLSDLNGIKRSLVNLRSDYEPKMKEYSKMVSDRDFSQYLSEFDFDSQTYSFMQLSLLMEYADKKDEENRKTISSQIDDMFKDYTNLKDKYTSLELCAQGEILNYNPNGTIIEDQMRNMYDELVQDMQDRNYIGQQKIDKEMQNVTYHLQFVSDQLSGMFNETVPLSDAVTRRGA